LGGAFVETDHRVLWIRLFRIKVEHILHARDILAIDLGNTPHVLAPGLEVIFGQAPPYRLPRDITVLGKLDHFAGQQFQGPTGAALRRLGTGRCNQQGLLFARELAACSRARLFG
jgi:hypothetical protein